MTYFSLEKNDHNPLLIYTKENNERTMLPNMDNILEKLLN